MSSNIKYLQITVINYNTHSGFNRQLLNNIQKDVREAHKTEGFTYLKPNQAIPTTII